MLKPIALRAGIQMLGNSFLARFTGIQKYKGTAAQICKQIIKDRWNGKFFETGKRNYPFFWSRDFGLSTESLLKLGYKKEVFSSLNYALDLYSKNDGIKLAIYKNKPFNFPNVYSPDGVALFIRSLRIANTKELIKKHKDLLNKEVLKFYETVLDKETGLVKRKTHFSGMRDHAIRDSSCYDNIMLAAMAEETKRLKLENPFKGYNFKKLIKEKFWTGKYFLDDLSGSTHITGDSNVFPFWLNIFNEKKMLKSAINEIQEADLDKPFPLKYISGRAKEKMIFIEKWLVPNWEKSTAWLMMGPLYIKIVKRVNKELHRFYLNQYKRLVEKYGNYLELFRTNGKPYKSLLYYADEGMLWSSMLLEMIK